MKYIIITLLLINTASANEIVTTLDPETGEVKTIIIIK